MIMRVTEDGVKPIKREVKTIKLLHCSCSLEKLRERLRRKEYKH